MRVVLSASVLAATALVASAGAALACAPYTFGQDGFGLERGIAWAFEGRVVREVPGEAGQGPRAVVIGVERTLSGLAPGDEFSIQQDMGCDPFEYGSGDEVIVAVPRYPGFVTDPGPADQIPSPYVGLTNYVVAVWVLDDDRVVPGDGPHSWPSIDGLRPATGAEVVHALAGLPDTATTAVSPVREQRDGSWSVPVLAGALALVIAIGAAASRRSPTDVP